MTQYTDEELLKHWQYGDNAAGEMLFDRYYPAVERFFRNKVPATELEDLVQESFIRMTKARNRVIQSDKFRSYLYRIARNVLNSFIRKRTRPHPAIDPNSITAWDIAPGPRDIVVICDEQRVLLEGLIRIPIYYQMLLELHYWEDFTTEQIAALFNKNRDTVKGQLGRARKALEDALGRLDELPKLIESTLSGIDAWARRCRRELHRAQVLSRQTSTSGSSPYSLPTS